MTPSVTLPHFSSANAVRAQVDSSNDSYTSKGYCGNERESALSTESSTRGRNRPNLAIEVLVQNR